MALKLRKDIKKSSYYVWFLGAKESKGLRGTDYILPVIQHLEKREKDIEPFKVTLQVSHKGLKIVQNVLATNTKTTKPKNETIKHFIPHNTITCVHQVDDVIACILLLFNPVTKCPLHVHAYRCDSLETAGLLRQQLQLLIDRPENQKKFAEIENRLLVSERTKKEAAHAAAAAAGKGVNKVDSSLGSDTGTSTATRESSDSSDDRFNTTDTGRITALYDSLAAELRAKLTKSNQPILLPPRDYDTVHRQKGNLTGIELRRCLNTNIVGDKQQQPGRGTRLATSRSLNPAVGGGAKRLESSGGSSGIGSDHAPSPESPDVMHGGGVVGVGVGGGGVMMIPGAAVVGVGGNGGGVDGHSTSDEEWNEDYPDPSIYLLNQATVPKSQPPINQNPQYYNKKYLDNQEDSDNYRKRLSTVRNCQEEDEDVEEEDEHDVGQDGGRYYDRQVSQHDESKDGRTQRYIENRMESYQKKSQLQLQQQQQGNVRRNEVISKRYSMDEDDGFEDNEVVYRTKSRQGQARPRSSYFESELPVQPVPKARHHLDKDLAYLAGNRQSMPNCHYTDDYRQPKQQQNSNRHYREEEFFESGQQMNRYRNTGDYFDENNSLEKRQQVAHQRELDLKATSPRERFYDAKEKFLMLEKERDEMQIKIRQQAQQEVPISPMCKEQPYLKRHESLTRYQFEQHNQSNNNHPKPAPRNNLQGNSQQQQPQQPKQKQKSHSNNNDHIEEHNQPVHRYRNHNNAAAAAATAMLDQRYQQQQQVNTRNTTTDPRQHLVQEKQDKYDPRQYQEKYDHQRHLRDDGFGHRQLDKLEQQKLKQQHHDNHQKQHEQVNYDHQHHLSSNSQDSKYIHPPPQHQQQHHHQHQRHLVGGGVDKYDQKRRSMYNLIEDEHKRNSAEIARELKRRSYMESGGGGGNVSEGYVGGGGGGGGGRRGGGVDTGEKEKELGYSTLEKDQFLYGKDHQFSKSSIELDKLGELTIFTNKNHQHHHQKQAAVTPGNNNNNNNGIPGNKGHASPSAGCRHSYVEPQLKYRQDRNHHHMMQMHSNKKQYDHLHRTNSSVSNTGRVGIASIHPY